MSVFSKEDIRDWAVMFANRCRFTTPVYETHSVEHGFKEGVRVAIEKMQANDVRTSESQLTIPLVSNSLIAFNEWLLADSKGFFEIPQEKIDEYLSNL